MRKKILILIMAICMLIFFAAMGAYGLTRAQKPEEDKRLEIPEKPEKMLSPEETIRGLVEVLYTYDTSERMFYEGAETFMTREAYETIVPLADGEDDSGEMQVNRMVSELQELTCYFRTAEQGRVEALAVIWYRLSGSGEFGIRQIVRMSLVQEDGWKINECTVLDTMEQ